jgi:hypothetical protein
MIFTGIAVYLFIILLLWSLGIISARSDRRGV